MPEHVRGTVDLARGGEYEVRLDDGQSVQAILRGRLKRGRPEERVVVGDRVTVAFQSDRATIEERAPRRTRLIRGGSSLAAPKVMAANLDRLVVVVAAARPDPHPRYVDRLLVLGEAGGLSCALVINKIDLDGAGEVVDEFRRLLDRTGYPILPVSAETGEGLSQVQDLICEGSSVLAGPSGAGKSTLIARVQPGLELRVGDVSDRTGTGRHTTVASRLIRLDCGGVVADTPGFGEVAPWGFEPEELAHLFPEFRPYLGECHFRGCTHVHEPGCSIRDAVEAGLLSRSRYESYGVLLEGASGRT